MMGSGFFYPLIFSCLYCGPLSDTCALRGCLRQVLWRWARTQDAACGIKSNDENYLDTAVFGCLLLEL